MDLKRNKNYTFVLKSLKERIRDARRQASLNANVLLLELYWEIGNTILQQQKVEGWGTKIIDRLARDLKVEFPDLKGFSLRNLKYMRAFAEAYPEFLNHQFSNINRVAVQEPLAQLNKGEEKSLMQAKLAQLPWYHHITLLDKVKNPGTRLFYIQKAVENGWSRNVMVAQIESLLHKRQGKAINNFGNTLPVAQSDLAKETFKNPYVFDFLGLSEEVRELELEKALINHIKKFMLELGRGFSYVGNQYNLEVDGNDYFLDLLFFNYHLDCFVVFELKVGEFRPEFAGKLNFYINTVDEKIKSKAHKPTIGILLCKTSKETVVKFALKGINSPIGVADYELAQTLPDQLKGEIPTIEELESVIDEETEKLLHLKDEKLAKVKELIRGLGEEEVKEKRNQKNTIAIFNKLIKPLKEHMVLELQREIKPMFYGLSLRIGIDKTSFDAESVTEEQVLGHSYIGEFHLEVTLEGFKQAGKEAFNIWSKLYVLLKDYKYVISFDHQGKNPIKEKLYHQFPEGIEIVSIKEEFVNNILEDITARLESLKN